MAIRRVDEDSDKGRADVQTGAIRILRQLRHLPLHRFGRCLCNRHMLRILALISPPEAHSDPIERARNASRRQRRGKGSVECNIPGGSLVAHRLGWRGCSRFPIPSAMHHGVTDVADAIQRSTAEGRMTYIFPTPAFPVQIQLTST